MDNIFARCKNFSVLTLEFFAQRKSVGFLHHFQDFRLQRQHSADIQGVPWAVGPAFHAVETVVHVAGNDGHAVLVGDGQLAADLLGIHIAQADDLVVQAGVLRHPSGGGGGAGKGGGPSSLQLSRRGGRKGGE